MNRITSRINCSKLSRNNRTQFFEQMQSADLTARAGYLKLILRTFLKSNGSPGTVSSRLKLLKNLRKCQLIVNISCSQQRFLALSTSKRWFDVNRSTTSNLNFHRRDLWSNRISKSWHLSLFTLGPSSHSQWASTKNIYWPQKCLNSRKTLHFASYACSTSKNLRCISLPFTLL